MLAPGFTFPGIFDQRQDLGNCGFAERLCDLHPDKSGQVDTAADDGIAHRGVTRHRFASQCNGIQRSCTFQNGSVQRDFLAGAHLNDISDRDLLRRDLRYGTVALQVCGIGADRHQRRNGGAALSDGDLLKQLADAVEQHDEHRFRVLPDSQCADRCQCHQEIFIEHLSVRNIFACLAQDAPADQEIRHEEQAQHLPAEPVRRLQHQLFQDDAQNQQSGGHDYLDQGTFLLSIHLCSVSFRT